MISIKNMAAAPCLLIVSLALASFAPAQSDRDLEQLLKSLEQLADKRTRDKDNAFRQVHNTVREAAASGGAAVNAFTEAYRNIELAGRTAQASEFQSWRENNRGVLNSNEFRTAAQLHAEYIALSLQRAQSDKPEDFVQPSFAYLRKLEEAWSKLFNRQERPSALQNQLLRPNFREGLMAKNWNLAPFLTNLNEWEFSPGNAEGILEKNIRPHLRKAGDAKLLDTWDWQMKFEEAQFPQRDRSHAWEMFQSRRIPELRMRQAMDKAALGQQLAAARDAVEILGKFPEHPSFDEWVRNVRSWLETARNKPAPPTPATAPPETGQPDESGPANPEQE
jgi:hypothetical protein